MSYTSAEEVKQGHVEKMGPELGTLYSALWQELATTHFYWSEYVELFGTKPERIDLFNRAAPTFFKMIEDQLWEQSLLHLSRLTDASRTFSKKGKSNLTVKALPELIADPKLKQEVQVLVAEATRTAEFARDWRNRRIAHLDLKIALEEETTPLPEASRARVNHALKGLSNVLNAIDAYYYNSETAYDFTPSAGGALSLLYILDDGVRVQTEREEKLAAGKFDWKDARRRAL